MSHIATEDSPPARFRILDLFAGPGGLDVAAHVLGHEVTGIEWDKGACATRSAAGMDTFQGDVRHYRAAFFPRAQVLTGGPPCQTFTVAGHGAGRRALDQVLEYIERLHTAVRPENEQGWREIFHTWRQISEELRRREIEAKEVRSEKRKVEEVRSAKRRAMKNRLEHLGISADSVKKIMKQLRAPQNVDSPDGEFMVLLKEFSELSDELDKLKDKLEEFGDERTGLVLQPLWWVIERSRRPGSEPYQAVVLEQVPAVMPVWKEYAKVLATLGYRTGTQLMHTEEFGVPQTRRRAVLMARLDPTASPTGLAPLPKVPETHERYRPGGSSAQSSKAGRADPLPLEDQKDPCISIKKALETARSVETEQSVKKDLPERPAFTVISNYGTGGDPEARGERDYDAPSATITGKVSRNRLVHKGTNRDLSEFDRFTPTEAGVLQTFPVEYPWRGNDVSQQIGNAVPPRLALHVLRHVLEPELGRQEVDDRMKLAVEELLTWKQPAEPVRIHRHRDLKGHQLARRHPLPLTPEVSGP
ncbi:DNA cytosine methyltransferase [Streptomyces sp. NBC_00328]|uniref:DNA cytosine methyltransferase n=1 Tax=Streptomyces sp. NBC_00328 TaxID=2903646 RepID=UPI002E2BC926|nr:DNA cytosine methyltransferase [Streptomyces sp. NBC_00328]